MPPSARVRRAAALLTVPLLSATIAALTLTGPATASQQTAVPESPTGDYLVQLDDSPVAEYDGDIAGLSATRVVPGGKLLKEAAPVVSYLQHLAREREEILARIPDATKLYDYDYTYAGFSARMSHDEAVQLAKESGVKSVEASGFQHQDTVGTPQYLGLSGKGGAWQRAGGVDKAGDGVIIGMIDSGFVPERPSFAPMKTTKQSDAAVARKWKGSCRPGVEAPVACNNKVIGARYFDAGIGNRPISAEFRSPRDYAGHGTHTASIAAGNSGVDMSVLGRDYGKGSGIAPHARLAIYKVLWAVDAAGGATGTDADIVAGIDAAVADGVDVINYSISGPGDTFVNSVGLAFLRAARAGVFVATSAGNTGPGVSTVGKNYPWVTTVANGTHEREIRTKVTFGNGTSYVGAGIGAGTTEAPVILPKDAALQPNQAKQPNQANHRNQSNQLNEANHPNQPNQLNEAKQPNPNEANQASRPKQPNQPNPSGANQVSRPNQPNQANLCLPKTLDPAKVTGKIVVCDRGVSARVDKSLQVKNAGGVGMILLNTTPGTLDADLHTIPTVHLDHLAAPKIKAYVQQGKATAKIGEAQPVKVNGPKVASSSSRGPALAGNGDLLKPDIMAPGTNVLAATTAFAAAGGQYAFMSGTSMSTPHIAGAAAILKGRHPSWSPMAIKSALLTTATTADANGNPISNDSGSPGSPFGYGAGMVQPKPAMDPGLVYDSSYDDWTRFVCGSGQVPATHELCANGKVDPSDLNYPTIAIGDLAPQQTVTRTVRNVGLLPEVYIAKIQGLKGLRATVTPKLLVVLPGGTATYSVTFERIDAPLDRYAFGQLTWRSARHTVTSTLAIRTHPS